MGERPGVEILADLADELAVGAELQDLRRGVAVGRAGARAAARVDEDVALGVDRDAGDLAEVHVVRQLQQIGHRVDREWPAARPARSAAGATSESKAASHSLHGNPPSSLFIGANARRAHYSGMTVPPSFRTARKHTAVFYETAGRVIQGRQFFASDRLPQPFQGTPMRKLLALTAGALALVILTVAVADQPGMVAGRAHDPCRASRFRPGEASTSCSACWRIRSQPPEARPSSSKAGRAPAASSRPKPWPARRRTATRCSATTTASSSAQSCGR